ncbi:MAG: alpha/beta fold hydrolase [Bryobacteraceae bacterium]
MTAALLAFLFADAMLDGAKVHYQSLGKGDTAVVFIHGWTCDGTFWRLQTPAVAPRRRALLVDLPGHGQSGKPRVAYTMPLMARGVEAAMRDAGVKRAVLVGHSMGVPVARQVIRMFPGKVIGFVAVDGRFPKKPGDPAELAKHEKGFADFTARFRGPDYKENLLKSVEFMLGPAAPAPLREEIKTKMSATPQHVMVSAMEGMADWTYGDPSPIRVPVLAVFARGSGIKPEEEKFAASFIPKLEWVVWDGVGHFLMMEKPEEFNRLLNGFLDTVSWTK